MREIKGIQMRKRENKSEGRKTKEVKEKKGISVS